MSIDSNYTNRVDITLSPNKPLQGSLSHREHLPLSRHSLKSPTKEHNRKDRSKSRNRTASMSNDSKTETITELTSTGSKSERRFSELKRSIDHHEHTPVDRRNSIPQLNLSSIFSHFNPKHHNKTNTKDETNPNSHTDAMAAKSDLVLTLKSPTDGAKLIPSLSSERLLSSQNEDSIGSTTFIFNDYMLDHCSAEFISLESSTPICISEKYRDLFYDHFHTNYYGEFDYEGPFLASLKCLTQRYESGEVCEAHAIIRTQYRNCYITDRIDKINENNILQILLNKVNFANISSYGTIGDPKANEKLYSFDKTNDERFNCKIGVIYQQQNQSSEFEIFSNDHMSNEMVNFLNLLAERVRLKGLTKYRGDLDIKEDSHGEYSYHTIHEYHEIMFNIAPLIHTTKVNGQCVERKGLIGNAFVCIVFQDVGAVFSPDLIPGRVTQIYITVQPTIIDRELYYKIGVWRRNDITSIVDPPGGTFKCDELFRKYFLTLLLNAVNVAIESPSLRARTYQPRQRIKLEDIKKLSQIFALGPLPDFFPNNEHIYPIEMRNYTRSDSVPSNSSIGANDSSNTTGTGRTSPSTTKKRGLSKIFNVFSSRSSSISSPSNQTTNDHSQAIAQSPPTPDSLSALVRAPVLPPKDIRTRSTKTTQAPIPPSRSMNSQVPHKINIHPPTPAVITLNPLSSDNVIQTNLLNTNMYDMAPRSRSNSSPEDVVCSNQVRLVSTINEEDQYADEYETSDTEEEEQSSSTSSSEESSSENETPDNNKPSRYS